MKQDFIEVVAGAAQNNVLLLSLHMSFGFAQNTRTYFLTFAELERDGLKELSRSGGSLPSITLMADIEVLANSLLT